VVVRPQGRGSWCNDLCAELEGLFGDDDFADLMRNVLLRRRYEPLRAREEGI
jgi:hypothetical protein